MVRRPSLATALCVLTVALVLAVGSTCAHEQKSVLTTIEVNARTKMLEVIHRFSLHDVEHAARALGWSVSDILQNNAVQAQFGEMVAQQFSVATDHELTLALLGQELDGRYLWVYQEAPAPASMSPLVITSQVLRRIWPTHQHLVNISFGDTVRSVTFARGVSRQTLTTDSKVPDTGNVDSAR